MRAEETAEIFGLSGYLDYMSGALPHGLQRLVGIALAFAARPRLLCLDEPLTGLNQTEVASTLEVFMFQLDAADHGSDTLLFNS